jgi:hypothetical protein
LAPQNRREQTGRKKAPRSAWQPGQSGNPGGRPKLTPEQKADEFALVQACRAKSPAALRVIEDLMLSADRDSVRLAAATFIIERGWGKAAQAIEQAGGGEKAAYPRIRVEFVRPPDPHSNQTSQVGGDRQLPAPATSPIIGVPATPPTIPWWTR